MNPPIDNLEAALRILPGRIQEVLKACRDYAEELVLDVGCKVCVKHDLKSLEYDFLVEPRHLEDIAIKVGGFRPEDGRASIEGCLHRVSGEYEYGQLAKITLRLARLSPRCGRKLIHHVVQDGKPKGLLMVGPPGSRKTTRLRTLAFHLGERFGKYVVVVDSANEIGGDSLTPHPAIGKVRRFRVTHPREQAQVIYRAVSNHYPLVVLIDELRRKEDVLEVASAMERGVKPIATVHGYHLEQVIAQPDNWPVLGMGLVEGRPRRIKDSLFEVLVVIEGPEQYRVYSEANAAIDAVLESSIPNGFVERDDDEAMGLFANVAEFAGVGAEPA